MSPNLGHCILEAYPAAVSTGASGPLESSSLDRNLPVPGHNYTCKIIVSIDVHVATHITFSFIVFGKALTYSTHIYDVELGKVMCQGTEGLNRAQC